MTSIDLLRTLNDDELIAFILMMSRDTEILSQWVLNVLHAKEFVKGGMKRDYIGCKVKDFYLWKRNLLNEACKSEQKIYNGTFNWEDKDEED